MSIIIVAEKPSMAKRIAPYARAHWPDADITLISALPYGNFSFVYPRGLAWKDFPHLGDYVYKLAPWENWSPRKVHPVTANLTPCEMTDELFRAADTLVCACDPDHTGAIAFATLVEKHFGSIDARVFPSLFLWSYDDKSIREAFDAMGDFKVVHGGVLAYGRVKRYFDWNWNTNALAILGATARLVGVPADAPPLSKYGVQLLYWLADRPPELSEGQVCNAMDSWRGTGKHAGVKVRLGSAASIGKIIQDLLGAGLIVEISIEGKKGKKLSVTERGHALLAALHKDCRDVDLPFRLDTWGKQGLGVAKDGIDRYLRTFFGKQKKVLSRSMAMPDGNQNTQTTR